MCLQVTQGSKIPVFLKKLYVYTHAYTYIFIYIYIEKISEEGYFVGLARSKKLTFAMRITLHEEKCFWIISLEKSF